MEKELETVQKMLDSVITFFINYSFQVIGAFIILIAGFLVGRWVYKIVLRMCLKKELDTTLSQFLASCCKIAIIACAGIVAMNKFGITIAPFIAAIGAAAFGATYAIQGPLSNYGAGLAIILGRQFLVGDTISVAGADGVVTDIKLACTILETEDGVTVTIPNKHVVGEILHNSKGYRIVEGSVKINYSDNPDVAIGLIQDSLANLAGVSDDPQPQVGIENFGDSAMAVGYRYWVPSHTYFQNLHTANMAVYRTLKNNGITIPLPPRQLAIVSGAACGQASGA